MNLERGPQEPRAGVRAAAVITSPRQLLACPEPHGRHGPGATPAHRVLARGPSGVVPTAGPAQRPQHRGGGWGAGVGCRWRGEGGAPGSDRVPTAGGESGSRPGSGPGGSQEAAQAGRAHSESGLAALPCCQGWDQGASWSRVEFPGPLAPGCTEKNNGSAVKTIYFALQETNSCLQSACLSGSLGWPFCGSSVPVAPCMRTGPAGPEAQDRRRLGP